MKTVVFTNQKGGVGKTTSAYALATGLHNKGYSVLIVDADPQSNVTYTAGIDEYRDKTLYDVFRGKCSPADAIRTVQEGLDIMSVGLQATAADMELAGRTAREYMLKNALQGLQYDFCVIDTAPTLGLLTLNALTAADALIVPMCVEIYSLQGAEQLQDFISTVQKYTNSDLKVSGILLTKYHEKQNITAALMDNIQNTAAALGTVVYDAKIRESVAVKETALLRGELYAEAPKATATIDYKQFVDEFIKREVKKNGKKK